MITLTTSSPHSTKNLKIFPTGVEPVTTPVYRVRDNQYTKETGKICEQNDLSVPQKSDTIFEILGCRVLFWAGFSSAEWFGMEFRQFVSIFVPRNGIFRVVFSSAERVRREFREYASIFVSTERNSEFFSLPLKFSEGNSENLLLFLFNGTEFRVVCSSAEGLGTELRGFLFRGTARIPSEITICSVYSIFRGIIFCRKFPTLASGERTSG